MCKILIIDCWLLFLIDVNNCLNVHQIIHSKDVFFSGILSNMFKSPQSRVQTESLPPLDRHTQQVSVLGLSCLCHLYSWIPLSTTITSSMLSTVFQFAAFGCEATPGKP